MNNNLQPLPQLDGIVRRRCEQQRLARQTHGRHNRIRMCIKLSSNTSFFQIPWHNVPICAASQHQRLIVRPERNWRDWTPILLELHDKLIEFQIEQRNLSIGQTDRNDIDGWCRLQHRNFAVKLLKCEHQLAFLDVPQLQTALFTANHYLIQIRGRMTDGRNFEFFISERDLSEFRLIHNVPHLQRTINIDWYQMNRSKWQQRVNFLRVTSEIVLDDVSTAPCVDFGAGTRINEAWIRCNGRNIFGMQTTDANQSKMFAAVDVKRSPHARCDHIVLAI